MINFEDDLDDMLSTDDFGIVFEYQGVKHNGILTTAYMEQDVGDVGNVSYEPVLIVKNLTFPRNTELRLSGNMYSVQRCEPNGHGMTVVLLHAL